MEEFAIHQLEKSGRNRYGEVEAKRYGRAFAVSWLWLMHKLGEPKGKPADLARGFAHPDQVEYGALAEPGGRLVPIPLLPESWLFALGLDPAFTDVVRLHGDSMSPAIEDGDWIFIDRRVSRFAADDIYLFWDGHALAAKSLAVVPASHPPRVRILSANPKYPPDELPLDRIKIIGRVRFRIGRIVRQA